jgi:hypothetical protein
LSEVEHQYTNPPDFLRMPIRPEISATGMMNMETHCGYISQVQPYLQLLNGADVLDEGLMQQDQIHRLCHETRAVQELRLEGRDYATLMVGVLHGKTTSW